MPGNVKLQKSPTKVNNAKKNDKVKRSRSKSPQRSIDPKKGNKKDNKNALNKSKSEKKLNKSLSMSRVDAGKKLVMPKLEKSPKSIAKVNNNNSSLLMKSARTKTKQ